jgi:hypothetical protein
LSIVFHRRLTVQRHRILRRWQALQPGRSAHLRLVERLLAQQGETV